jgi:hypothetical protein
MAGLGCEGAGAEARGAARLAAPSPLALSRAECQSPLHDRRPIRYNRWAMNQEVE